MSLTEIIEELPKLTPAERRTIYQQIEKLDGEPEFEATPEMLAAIDEGTRSAQTEQMHTVDERVLVEGPILIFYRPDDATGVIEIKRFWHGARGTPQM